MLTGEAHQAKGQEAKLCIFAIARLSKSKADIG